MGFGSYDESEQENQAVDTDFGEDEVVNTSEHDHEGSVEYEFGDTNSDDLLDKLQDIKGRDASD